MFIGIFHLNLAGSRIARPVTDPISRSLDVLVAFAAKEMTAL